MNTLRKVVTGCAVSLGVLIAGQASALTLHPTASCATTDVSGATACVGMIVDNGIGSPAKNDSVAAMNGNSFFGYGNFDGPTNNWELVAKVNEPATSSGGLTVSYASDLKSGSYSYSGSGYSVYAVVLKASAGFSVYMMNGVTSADWTTANLLNGGGVVPAISHISLYGVKGVSTVPVPAALPLGLSGMIALGAVARRRRKS